MKSKVKIVAQRSPFSDGHNQKSGCLGSILQKSILSARNWLHVAISVNL